MDENTTLLDFEFDNVPEGRGVTSLIKNLEPEFDRNAKSKATARRTNRPQAEILAEWDRKGVEGRELGTALHEYIATILGHEQVDPITALTDKHLSMHQFDRFWQKAQHQFTVCWVEKSVASDYFMVRGRIDALLFNANTQKHHIVDWKRGAFSSKGWDPLFAPFDDMRNSPAEMGALQTSIYRSVIEHCTGVELGQSYLVFLSDYTFTVRPMADARERVQRWLLTGARDG